VHGKVVQAAFDVPT